MLVAYVIFAGSAYWAWYARRRAQETQAAAQAAYSAAASAHAAASTQGVGALRAGSFQGAIGAQLYNVRF